jgi:hypothetical protein
MGASGNGDDRATSNAPGSGPAPELSESLRELGDTGKATLQASVDAAKAFRTLVLADISLARSAFGRALAFTGVAIAFGASAWLLLMAALIVFLSNGLGWPWTWSLLLTAAISLVVTGFGAWSAIRYFEHTRLQATRRQLARLGIGELAEFTPTPGSRESTRQATEAAPPETPAGEPVKDQRGVDITPP